MDKNSKLAGLYLDFEASSFAGKNPNKSLEDAFKAGVRLAQKKMIRRSANEDEDKIAVVRRGLPLGFLVRN